MSLTCVMAWVLWGSTFLLLLSGTLLGAAVGAEHIAVVMALMAHGLACSAAAATVTIRSMFIHQNRLLRDAFTLGQDSAGARPVRRLS